MRAWLAGFLVGAVLVLLPLTSAAAAERLPAGFFGVAPQQPVAAGDLARMRGVVGTLRIPVYWWQCEPSPGAYDFGALDAEIAAATASGIAVRPVVYGTPGWLSREQARPPLGARANAAWAKFLRVLVQRYGSGGEFWRGRSQRMPIRQWQVWNEPNFVVFWKPRPNPHAYARLLRVSARAIRSTDHRARIVLAGVAPVGAGMKLPPQALPHPRRPPRLRLRRPPSLLGDDSGARLPGAESTTGDGGSGPGRQALARDRAGRRFLGELSLGLRRGAHRTG